MHVSLVVCVCVCVCVCESFVLVYVSLVVMCERVFDARQCCCCVCEMI